jgi:Zn-dependent protease with chaperone function
MMRREQLRTRWQRNRSWIAALVTGLLIVLLTVNPTPLFPLARGYGALCDQYPPLALLTLHAPPLPLALLLSLAGVALFTGIWAASTGLARTLRFNRRVRDSGHPLPPRLVRAGISLGIVERLTYLERVDLAACCYGFVRPRIAVTAGLLQRLDDTELMAVLAHERRHLHRRDPARYLALHVLTAMTFMFPVAPAIRQRLEARIELAADRAALAVVPRGALAGALLAVLATPRAPVPGVAGLTATEARIAHLSGATLFPEIPARLALASLGLTAVIALAAFNLAAAAHLVEMVCSFCVGTS